ncbi:hypothetical protein BK816_04915 [Boudabousia tangfeifanii]|uniref:YdhG-like domain-containing protein n=1 Tax=Boudabousia tangfeifanii TaxID=1912795 RepID=A0A1D9MK79_9ACTO|nr:DUF1801 domain-containing protein [Boudabousia tangfeifanii]AOZ72714.1 hypothetical protein BK816_04915 [Boudabousia tangfeifanii]
MSAYDQWLAEVPSELKRQKLTEILQWIQRSYPDLTVEIKWKQPMFIDPEGHFIIAFSYSKPNILVAPEGYLIEQFSEKIIAAGYSHGKKLMRIGDNQAVDYDLLSDFIETNLKVRKGTVGFWHKS